MTKTRTDARVWSKKTKITKEVRKDGRVFSSIDNTCVNGGLMTIHCCQFHDRGPDTYICWYIFYSCHFLTSDKLRNRIRIQNDAE